MDDFIDILITIPKTTSWYNYAKELKDAENGYELNYKVSSKPKRIIDGESRCYIVHCGVIKGYMTVCRVEYKNGFTSETDGRVWPEGWYIVRTGSFIHLENLHPHTGFQGYRYIDRI